MNGDLGFGNLYPPPRALPHTGPMKKRSDNDIIARLDSQKNKPPRGSSKPYRSVKPRINHADFMQARWLKSLSPQDRDLIDSENSPARRQWIRDEEAARKAAAQLTASIPKSNPSISKNILTQRRNSNRSSLEPAPNSREGKKLAQQRLVDAEHERGQRVLLHVEARIRKMLAEQALVEPDIYDDWKKSIRPWKEPE